MSLQLAAKNRMTPAPTAAAPRIASAFAAPSRRARRSDSACRPRSAAAWPELMRPSSRHSSSSCPNGRAAATPTPREYAARVYGIGWRVGDGVLPSR